MNHDTEILSWIIEYACSKNYPDLLTACHAYLSEEEQENLPPLATVYNLLATLSHICKIEDFHSNDQLRFALMIQSATLIFTIEEKMKEFLGGKSVKTEAAEVLEECYYQAVLCFATKRELEGAIAAEETSPSQQALDARYQEEVIQAIKKLVKAVIKSNKIPKSMLDAHELGDFENLLAKYVEDNKVLLPIPTLLQFSKKRHPQMPTDIKPYTLDELYFAWDGHDIEWQMLQDLTHPDIKTFYRNNPNMPKEIRDYVKALPDSKVKLQKVKSQSGSPITPHFSHSRLSSPSPSSSKSPSGTFTFKPISQQQSPKNSQGDERADELGGMEGDEEEEEEKEKDKKKKDDKSPKRKRSDATLGRDLMRKSKRLHAIGEDPLVAALEYGNQIRKMLNENKHNDKEEDSEEEEKEKVSDKNKKKKKEVHENEESEEEQNNKKQKKKNNQKNKKAKKNEDSEEEEEEEEEVEKPTKKTRSQTTTKKGKKKEGDEEDEESEEVPKPSRKTQNTKNSQTKKGKKDDDEGDEDEVVAGSKKNPSPQKAKTSAKKGKKESEEDDEDDFVSSKKVQSQNTKKTTTSQKGKKKEEESDDKKGDDKENESDSDADFFEGLRLKSPKKGPKIKIAKRKFSTAEEQYLLKGVERFGAGKWKDILMSYNFNNRTTVDLKDKWRNIMKSKKD